MSNQKSNLNILGKGILKENPVFVSLLGMCPTLAVTTSAFNGIGMGLSTTFVLICSNLVICLLKAYTLSSKASMLYSNHCNIRNPYTIFTAWICTITVYKPWCISGTDHCKLYNSWKSRNVRKQE